MLKLSSKVSAGTFLVPLIVSMVLYTFWPDLFKVGGFTEALFSSSGVNIISGLLAFTMMSVAGVSSIVAPVNERTFV